METLQVLTSNGQWIPCFPFYPFKTLIPYQTKESERSFYNQSLLFLSAKGARWHIKQVVVSPLLGVVFDKLASLIHNKFGELWGVQKEMKKLSKTLSSIKYVLNHAEEKQVGDERIREWLQELKYAAYAAEDVLEEWAFKNQQLASEKVTDSLQELMENFDELVKEGHQFDLQRGHVNKGVGIHRSRKTGSFLTEPQVFGRNHDKKRLVSLLLSQSRPQSMHPSGQTQRPLLNNVNTQEGIVVCSILGMGGLGKTTLAQLVYNDEQVANHFQIRSWVCVSDDFDVTCLIKAIIASVSRNACNLEDLDPLQKRLQEELNGKRFLLVLDDVWEDDQGEWNKLKGLLRCGKEGSCVIVTTRLDTVAFITSTVSPYRLQALSEDHCWSLFKQYAFGLGNKERPALVEIGMEIVAKCGGLPLAAKALGGLLRFENNESVWLSIRDSEIWELPQHGETGILPVLTLSYNNLSPLLKRCFTYCSIFPKDHNINIKELILLWMANGLVENKGKTDLEDEGNNIFYALLWRSFFQDIKKDQDGNMLTCKMHDLVHDLACYMAANECESANVGSGGNISEKTLHVFIKQESSSSFTLGSIQTSSPCLRSLIWLGYYTVSSENPANFFSLMRLRALDLHYCGIEMVPDCIGEMIHLRYLNLSNNPIKSLSECISGLKNLQTLNVSGCYKLQSLPKDMSQMVNLRHLDIQGCGKLKSMPINIGKLVCLHTMSIFIVGLANGCSIKELQGVNHLGGELEIKKLENVSNSLESREASLKSKKNLRTLELSWSEGLEEVQENVIEVIEGLQPHSNLRRCFVGGYQGVTFPSWLTVSTLPNLVEIKLSRCRRCVRLPPLGKLPFLKVLEMYSMDSVKIIDEATYGNSGEKEFLSLEDLSLDSMLNLEGWSSSTQTTQLPCLKTLTLRECPKLTCECLPLLGKLPFLKVLKMCSMDSMKFIDGEVYGEGERKRFPSLEEVSLHLMPNLEGWSSSDQAATTHQLLPCLTHLTFRECPKLKGPIPLSSSLRHIETSKCNETVLGYVRNLPCLSTLRILEFDEMVRFPKGALHNLTSLEQLSIVRCKELKALPAEVESLTTLKTVWIENCGKLVSLGKRSLSSLKTLCIRSCPNLKHLPKLNKTCLEGLEISYCPELELSTEEDFKEDLLLLKSLILFGVRKLVGGFPEALKHAAMLQTLQILGCYSKEEKNEMDLPEWIGTLTSLKRLHIEGCKNHEVLLEGMQNLTALVDLSIFGCNEELERRCETSKGEDWFKIAHVPHVKITRKPYGIH